MNECIYLAGNGLCSLKKYQGLRCSTPYTCKEHTQQTSLLATRDDGVSPRSGGDPVGPGGVGDETRHGVDALPDVDVPETDPESPRHECRCELRPLGFGVAGLGSPHAAMPVLVMVCGRALDGECPRPCTLGMYSTDIVRAYDRAKPAGRILAPPGVQDVRRSRKI